MHGYISMDELVGYLYGRIKEIELREGNDAKNNVTYNTLFDVLYYIQHDE